MTENSWNNGPGEYPVRGAVSTMAVSDLYGETAHRREIPRDHEVVPVDPDGYMDPDAVMTCGTCHTSWDDNLITGITPVPSGRCPFEAWHKYDEDEAGDEEGDGTVLYNNVNDERWTNVMDLRMAIESGHFNPRSEVRIQERPGGTTRAVRRIEVRNGRLYLIGY